MNAIVTQMIILFIIVIIGYFLSKKKMMDADFDRKLSVLVINVTCPSLILSSVMGDTLPDKSFISFPASTASARKGCRPGYL